MTPRAGFAEQEVVSDYSMTAYIYGRYSSHNQKDVSIEQQFRDIYDYCRKNNIRVIGEYADRALTGKTDKRPQFQKMIQDAAKGRVQLIICWKVDRFARNREDAAVYKGRLRRHGVRVIYAMEPIPEGAAGILLEGMLESTAEWYSANLSENIKRGMYDNAQECKVNNGRLALGFKKGPDDRFAIEPAGAAIVREAFELYASGLNVREITEAFNARGLKTSRGAAFNKNSLRVMLKNEAYIGVYKYGKVRIEGGVPQIVDKELFDRVQERIAQIARAPASSWSDVDYLLTGKLYCGHCGHPMIGESGTGKSGRKYNYYTCSKRKRGKTCAKRPVGKDWLEETVVRETLERVLVDEVIEKIADEAVAIQKRERDTSILNSLEQQLKDTERALKNIVSAIEQGIITPTTRNRMMELEEQKVELQVSIEKEKAVKPLLTRDQIIYWIKRFGKGDISSERFRIQIIDAFVRAVYLYDDELRIVYDYSGEKASITLELVDGCDKDGAPECSALAFSSPPKCVNPNTTRIYVMESVFVLVLKLPAN